MYRPDPNSARLDNFELSGPEQEAFRHPYTAYQRSLVQFTNLCGCELVPIPPATFWFRWNVLSGHSRTVLCGAFVEKPESLAVLLRRHYYSELVQTIFNSQLDEEFFWQLYRLPNRATRKRSALVSTVEQEARRNAYEAYTTLVERYNKRTAEQLAPWPRGVFAYRWRTIPLRTRRLLCRAFVQAIDVLAFQLRRRYLSPTTQAIFTSELDSDLFWRLYYLRTRKKSHERS